MEKNTIKIAGLKISGKLSKMLFDAFFSCHEVTKQSNFEMPLEMFKMEKNGLIKVIYQTVSTWDGSSSYGGPGLKLSQGIEQEIELTKKGRKAMIASIASQKTAKPTMKEVFDGLIAILSFGGGFYSRNPVKGIHDVRDEDFNNGHYPKWKKFLRLNNLENQMKWFRILLKLEELGYGSFNREELYFLVAIDKLSKIASDYGKFIKQNVDKLTKSDIEFIRQGKFDLCYWEVPIKGENFINFLRFAVFFSGHPILGGWWNLDHDAYPMRHSFCIDKEHAKRLLAKDMPLPTINELKAIEQYMVIPRQFPWEKGSTFPDLDFVVG